ncbi:MAG: sialidase family protein, partial [Candidatus Nitrosopolaris sp.]
MKPVKVNGTITDSFLLLDHQPQVVVFGNNVYIAWVSHHTGNDDIYFTKSFDGGASFGKIINLSNDPGDSYEPHLAIDGKNLYVMWVDGTPGPYGNPDILFRRSTDGGTTFDSTINVSNNPGYSSEPEMAISGSNVYVVWRDDTPGNEEIFFKRSMNNGASFGTVVYLSDNSTKPINSVRPQIAANGNNVYVVWSKGNFDQGRTNVLFKRSTNNGASFGSTLNISNTPTTLSTLQKICVLGNKVYAVWAEGLFNKRQIFFKRSIDGGDTFGNTTNITNSTSGDSFNPQIATSDKSVYLLWQANAGNVSKQLFFKRSIDGGSTFGNTTNISYDHKDSAHALLYSSGNKVYAIWD